MTICDMTCNVRYKVCAVRVPSTLKERLLALGVEQGGGVTLLKISPFKKMCLIQTDAATLALRREAAEQIEVCPWKS